MRKVFALTVISLQFLPFTVFADQGGIPHHGGAPLPIVGVGIPGLAVAGALYLLRRKRKDNGGSVKETLCSRRPHDAPMHTGVASPKWCLSVTIALPRRRPLIKFGL